MMMRTAMCLTVVLAASAVASEPTTQPAAPKELSLDLGSGAAMKLALIPAGKFGMGSVKAEANSERDERPRRQVTISKPFYMGATEVTQAQWTALMGKNRSVVKGANMPVHMVSWTDAVRFSQAAGKKTGRTVRLPTEAEWEYACRAGAKGRFCFGEDDAGLDAYGWHKGNSGGKPHAVAGKKPNAWGLYDMHGNLNEWCSDYHHKYAGAATVDPSGPEEGAHRILRGGGYGNPAAFCRSANRAGAGPEKGRKNLGFRVVVEAAATGRKVTMGDKPIFVETFENLDNWRSEGPNQVRVADGRLHVKTVWQPHKSGQFVWLNRDLPDDFRVEYDVTPVSASGFFLIFFCAKGTGGEDILGDKLFKQYTKLSDFKKYTIGPVNCYHISYRRNEVANCNLRKNTGKHLIRQSRIDALIPKGKPAHVVLTKKGGRIRLAVNGKVFMDHTDDGKLNGGVYSGGKIGLRQVYESEGTYDNFRVFDLTGEK